LVSGEQDVEAALTGATATDSGGGGGLVDRGAGGGEVVGGVVGGRVVGGGVVGAVVRGAAVVGVVGAAVRGALATVVATIVLALLLLPLVDEQPGAMVRTTHRAKPPPTRNLFITSPRPRPHQGVTTHCRHPDTYSARVPVSIPEPADAIRR
jgi:hypothetical protein